LGRGIQVLISFFSIAVQKLIYSHEKNDIILCLYGIGFDGIRARSKHTFQARKESWVQIIV
jgi:hypothetical protein